MGICCGGPLSSPSSGNDFFFTQSQGPLLIPFGEGIETTVLTLPLTTTANLQTIKLDYVVQFVFALANNSNNFDYGVRVRLRRNGVLIVTQTLQQSGSRPGGGSTPSTTRREHVPNTWVDNGALTGENTYTVTVEFFQRANATTTLSAETRSLNAILFIE
ncbi:hypothetical protein [Metabacillus malikii]|uniref:Exosporium protein C n=1 Tax=Metabacillus malikii TaxID=1504265 RepID=A0ABT9ZEE7_9BACI|nr:hypothetical protein [Metabacillus malikii]MDQ0229640.1 hypothetical protein [Metabacillus malikii]